MMLFSLNAWFADAAATSGATSAQDPKAQMTSTILMLVLMAVMFYFVLIRPQQKKAKEQAKMLSAIKPGDKVFTSSGIIGVILSVKEKTVTLRSADAKLEVAKSAIADITERGGESSES
jgi:preprotein translocase subunit YajC